MGLDEPTGSLQSFLATVLECLPAKTVLPPEKTLKISGDTFWKSYFAHVHLALEYTPKQSICKFPPFCNTLTTIFQFGTIRSLFSHSLFSKTPSTKLRLRSYLFPHVVYLNAL